MTTTIKQKHTLTEFERTTLRYAIYQVIRDTDDTPWPGYSYDEFRRLKSIFNLLEPEAVVTITKYSKE